VREQLAERYYCLRHISTAPEWAPEFALNAAKFYISLHLQEGETVTTDLELRRESAFIKATTVELCGTVTTRRRRDLVAKTGPRPLGPRGQLGSTKNQSTEDWPLEGRSARPLSRQHVQQQLTEDAKVNLRSVLVRK
ncbi:hypothetical protein CAPTEDRAFT_213155, partial [Capitella teleta]